MDPVTKPVPAIRFGLCGAVCLLALLLLVPLFADTVPALEYRVKAAFLLNFVKFVERPVEEATLPGHLAICVMGEDPFGTVLDEVVQGEAVGARRIVVQRYASAPQERCDIAFVSKSVKEVPRLLAALGPGVLTVGEGERFLREGGMIAFVIDNGRVRFDVSQAAARNGSVRLSSRLLGVARSVEK